MSAGPWQPVTQLGEPIHAVRCCTAPLGKKLVLISTCCLSIKLTRVATDLTVRVFEVSAQGTSLALNELVSFVVGCLATALAWSPGTQYSVLDDEGGDGFGSKGGWRIE